MAWSVPPDWGVGVGRVHADMRLAVLGLVALAVSGLWLAAWSHSARYMCFVAPAVAIWALLAPELVSGLTEVFLLTQGLAVALAAGTLLCVSRAQNGEAAASSGSARAG